MGSLVVYARLDTRYEEVTMGEAQLFTPNPMTEAVQIATFNPDWFCDSVLRTPNDDWQSEGLNAVADVVRDHYGLPTMYNHNGVTKISVRAGHGPGKTHFMAKTAHWFNFVFKGRIIATAPKEQQLITRLWPEFRSIKTNAIKEYRDLIDVKKTKVVWCNKEDWVMLAETASQSENLSGHHRDYMLFLVDEASGVNEDMFPAIEGALSTGIIVIMVMIGNPTRNQGSFWASHKKKGVMEDYYKLHVTLDRSPRIKKKWVNAMIKKYGKDSPVVQIRCYGEFAELDANQLILLEWLEKARAKEFKEDGSIPRVIASCDVADGGVDETVITIKKEYDSFSYWVKQFRYSFKASEAPIDAAQATIRHWKNYGGTADNGDYLVIDAIGVGAGAAGYAIKKGYPVIPYKGGSSSDKPTQWRNRRVQSYIAMRNDLRDGKVVIANDFHESQDDWDDFEAQMCSIRTNNHSEKVEDLETKKELMSRGIKSPDMADSPAMSYATRQPVLGEPEESAGVIGVGQAQSNAYDGSLN